MWRLLMKKTSSPTSRARAKSAMAPSARMSDDSRRVRAWASSRRPPAATVCQMWSSPARAARAEMSLGFKDATPDVSAVPVHNASGDLVEQLALDEVGARIEDHAGLLNVPQSDGAGTFEGAALRHPSEDHGDVRVVDLVLCEVRAEFRSAFQGEDQRQGDG